MTSLSGRSAWRFLVVVLVAFLAGCGGDATTASNTTNPAPSSRSADGQPDSCAVFTQAEVQSFAGNEVAAGTDTGAGQGCYYAASGNGTAFLVNLGTGDSAAKFADAKSNAMEQTSVVEPVTAAGYDAFVYASKSDALVSGEARKGAIRVRVVIAGPGATVETAKNALIAAVAKAPSN